jgi:hypothetical protein
MRLIKLIITEGRIYRPPREDIKDRIGLKERHRRAMVWWCRSFNFPGASSTSFTAEDAFEAGRAAWNGSQALSNLPGHLSDFDAMIAAVPKHLHLPAIHGWRNGFDDEADRLAAARNR